MGFQCACSSFVVIDSMPAEAAAKSPPKAAPLDLLIRAMIAAHSRNGTGMRLAALGPGMHAQHGTRISTYPERNWRTYLAARPELYDLDPRGPDAMVRFKPTGFVNAS